MQRLSQSAYRFSIEWSRAEPQPGHWDQAALAGYQQRIQQLRSAGIEPFITLLHFTHPRWFEARGGWQNPENVKLYLRYVRKVAEVLHADVKYWNPINEPLVQTIMSYATGK